MKSLFYGEHETIIQLVNHFFKRKFNGKNCEVYSNSNEHINVKEIWSKIISDFVITIKAGKKAEQFHFEFQTKYDSSMSMRMFEYGLNIAKKFANKNQGTILMYPSQALLYLERDDSIGDSVTVTLTANQKFVYEVPVFRVWEFKIEKLISDKLYILMPTALLRFRKSPLIENFYTMCKLLLFIAPRFSE